MGYFIYDDNQRLIALGDTKDEAFSALMTYFKSLDGINSAASIPVTTACPFDAVFKVNSSKPLPKFIYLNSLTEAAKVYAKSLSKTQPDLSQLCNGVTSTNLVPAPVVSSIVTESADVVAPVISAILTEDANTFILQITGLPGSQGTWVVNDNYSSAVDIAGNVSLNISVKNTSWTNPQAPPTFSNQPIVNISAEGRPNNILIISGENNPNLPAGSQLTIYPNGNAYYTGAPTTIDDTGATIEFFMVKFNKNN